jgi:hypothetical protein
VVVSHNGERHLERCLNALTAQQLDGGFEVLLVDNGSQEESAGRAGRRFESVQVLRSESNLGFAGGNNLGIRASRAELIVLLNDDATVRPGWLSALVAAAEAEPKAGAVSSKVVFAERPAEIDSAGIVIRADGVCMGRGSHEHDGGQYERREQVFAACGNGMLLRRGALDRVGLLDEIFFAYIEDVDLCWRMRLDGWSILYEPGAVIDHVSAATSGSGTAFFHFLVLRNRFLALLKNAPWWLVARSSASFGALFVRTSARALQRRVAPSARMKVHPARPSWRIQVRAVLSIVRLLPSVLAGRRKARRGHMFTDRQLRSWLQPVTEDWYDSMEMLALRRPVSS